MSWEIFKQNMLRTLNSPESLTDLDVVADKWAKEYDAAVKRGFDTINQVTLKQGNVEIMKQLIKLALLKGQTSQTPYDLVGEMGKAVQAYWSGAIMNEFPIPLIPAPGSIQNVSVTTNLVTNPGVWTPAISVPGVNINDLESANKKIREAVFELTPEQIEIKELELQTTLDLISPTFDYNQLEVGGTELVSSDLLNFEYSLVLTEELETGEVASAPVDLTEKESEAVTENTDKKLKTTFGEAIVNRARSDINVGETIIKMTKGDKSWFEGGNSGGLKDEKNHSNNGRYSKPTSGRIDYMLDTYTGRKNFEKYGSKPVKGDAWCAAAVTTWWQEANVETPKSWLAAGVKEWKAWAEQNGYYQYQKANYNPPIGSALVYKNSDGSVYHIGIVASVDASGGITSIEGNTSGKSGDGQGDGVYQKVVSRSRLDGFVVHPKLTQEYTEG